MEGSQGVRSVERALSLLEKLESSPDGTRSVSDLSQETQLPPGTIHRLLRTLVARGYVRQLRDRRYGLGGRLAALGASAGSALGSAARPLLDTVARESGETANLAILSSGSAEYVAQAEGTHSMRIFTEIGERVPLHCSGVGKALLSTLDDREVLRLLHRFGMPALSPSTITSPELMIEELARIRARGYALDDGEMEVGVRCVAVPFHAAHPLAVSISGPAERMTDAAVARSAAALRRASRLLTAALDPGETTAA